MEKQSISARSITFGIVLIILGAGLLFDILGVIDTSALFRAYWPLLLFLFALGEFISKNRLTAVVLLIVGIVFQLNVLGMTDLNIVALFIAILIIWIGFNIIFRAYSRPAGQVDARDYIKATAIFGGAERKVRSQSFKGASLDAVFGGVDVDLREAKIAEEGAVIDVLVLFGGIDIVVPKDLPVDIRAAAVLGGSEDSRPNVAPREEVKSTLIVRGTVLFGGLEVKG